MCSAPPNSFVSDFANVLDEDSKQQLERKLEGLKKQGNIDFVVVTVNTTGNEPASTYSLDLARCWEVGAANSDKAGILLLIAIEDRKWHMQVSQSINEVLPDNEVLRLGNLMPESFRVRRYSEGVHKCVDATIAVLAERRGFSPT